MATLDVVNKKREKVAELELSDDFYGSVGNTHVVWEVVRAHLAAQRAGTHSAKGRGEVRGGGAKPWRQKGTGRARVGSSRNPLWRHGGVTHGPVTRSHALGLPKKKKRVAVRRVLADMIASERLLVLDQIALDEPKSRAFKAFVAGLNEEPRGLVVVKEADESLERACRNFPGVKCVTADAVNAYDLLKYRKALISRDGLERLQELVER